MHVSIYNNCSIQSNPATHHRAKFSLTRHFHHNPTIVDQEIPTIFHHAILPIISITHKQKIHRISRNPSCMQAHIYLIKFVPKNLKISSYTKTSKSPFINSTISTFTQKYCPNMKYEETIFIMKIVVHVSHNTQLVLPSHCIF